MDRKTINAVTGKATVYDLGMDYFVGMPHFATHPPFTFSLGRVHGDLKFGERLTSANCVFSTGGHTGTHMDALGHIAQDGQVYGVGDITPWQDYTGLKRASIDKTPPFFSPGVLLDIAGLDGVSCLPPDRSIGSDDLRAACERQKVTVEQGDTVLIRTGWIQHFEEARTYISPEAGCPGINEDAAQWLADRRVAAVGGDTVALEKTPAPALPVHAILLVENGVYILEALNLEKLAADGVGCFVFMVSPLKIRGGTGSPVRPVAVIWD